jgi:hypothetical protein
MFGEHRLLACSSRQLATNAFSSFPIDAPKTRSASCRTLQAGSLRSPEQPALARFSRRNPSAQVENGHAHGETVGDLVENYALHAIGQVAVDFDPAIDRARVHD